MRLRAILRYEGGGHHGDLSARRDAMPASLRGSPSLRSTTATERRGASTISLTRMGNRVTFSGVQTFSGGTGRRMDMRFPHATIVALSVLAASVRPPAAQAQGEVSHRYPLRGTGQKPRSPRHLEENRTRP